jgi:hypothetical protein
MKIGSSSRAERMATAAARYIKRPGKATHQTDEQKLARLQAVSAFREALCADIELYTGMKEEDVVDEYRQAGKLHTYDMDKEWKKRLARVAKLHPSLPWHLDPDIEEYMYYLEENEDDFRIGLYSLLFGHEILG